MQGHGVSQGTPHERQRRLGWVASRRQVIVSAVEYATRAAPMQGMTPRTLELALFDHGVRLSALTHGLSEAQCDAWTADMGAIMPLPVALWGASGFRYLVLKTQKYLGIMIEDLVDVLGRQV
jgi:hypothetical protein